MGSDRNRGIRLHAWPDRRMAYAGRAQLLTDVDGWVRGGMAGYYLDSTRFLSRIELLTDGAPLQATGVSAVDTHRMVGYYVASRDDPHFDPRVILRADHRVEEGLASRYRLDNHDRTRARRMDLALRFEADFVDRKAAEEGQDEDPVDASWDPERRELRFRRRRGQLERGLLLTLVDAPVDPRWSDGLLHLDLELPPGGSMELRVEASPVFDGRARTAPRRGPHGQEQRAQLLDAAPSLTTPTTMVAQAWSTAVQDLTSLPLRLEGAPATPAAGLPLYQEYYARDALTTAWQSLPVAPRLMRDALLYAARTLGTDIDDDYDEEPGKALARERWGPRSLSFQDPFAHHFGDYAGPCDFLIMLGQYLAWTDDVATLRAVRPAARSVLTWLERYGDSDGDGFIEYDTRVPDAMRPPVKNQGWKDSPTAVVDERGEVVPNPIATAELQGFLYAALQQSAAAFARLGDVGYATELLAKAERLKRRFDAAFWSEERGSYAMALGPRKEQVSSVGSHMGHLLASGIVPRHRAARVTRRLLRADLFSGWGIRTLSTEHPSYNPFSYHLGSVWPVEQGTVALGMARYGFRREAATVAEASFAASELFDSARLPEAISGLPRDDEHPHPGIYPHANDVQGWSSGSIVMLVQALLGLRPIASARTLLIAPSLPPWLPSLRLDGLRVGRGQVDLEVWRDRHGRSRFRADGRGLRVLRLPALMGIGIRRGPPA